ncbi:Conserved_hypothetical protein [Hexamita inflata]|uniref:Uncharacterized protein n=1 Tax=Hexamita inflata TaxID=28002 RepID=A0AA86UI66_9EUKA|nr:Conserved hypothetical protein [Hexamita inflata]
MDSYIFDEAYFAQVQANQTNYIDQLFENVEYIDQLYQQVNEHIAQNQQQLEKIVSFEQTYSKHLNLINQTKEKIVTTLVQVDEDSAIYKQLRDFTEQFLLPETFLEIFRGEFNAQFQEHIPKLVEVIRHQNFQFLFGKFKEKEGDDQISSLFKLMINTEQRILDFYKQVLNPQKDQKIKVTFEELKNYKYLLNFLYEINPKNQEIIEQQYFQYRQIAMKVELDNLQTLFKQYQYEQPCSNDYFQPDDEAVSDFHIFMPLISNPQESKMFSMKIFNKTYQYEKDVPQKFAQINSEEQQKIMCGFTQEQIEYDVFTTYINSYLFNFKHNNRNLTPKDISIKKVTPKLFKGGVKITNQNFDCQVFPEQVAGYMVNKIDQLLVQERKYYDNTLIKSSALPFEQSLIDQLEQFILKLIYQQFDLISLINFFKQTKTFLDDCANMHIIQMLNKMQMLCGYGLLLKYKAVFGNATRNVEMLSQLLDTYKMGMSSMNLKEEFNYEPKTNRVDALPALYDNTLMNKTGAASAVLSFRCGFLLKSLKQLEGTSLGLLYDGAVKSLKNFLKEKGQFMFPKQEKTHVIIHYYSYIVNFFAIVNKVVGDDVVDYSVYMDQLKGEAGKVFKWIK